MNKIRVATLFSGYDSQCLALERLKRNFPDFDYELVAWCEIDKAACVAHNALFPQWKDRNVGDIIDVDPHNMPDFDLLTMSSPCQDFSAAGKQAGGEEGSGTRSSLLWECTKIIEIKRPKYILFENVAALVSSKFVKGFNKWQSRLESFGYSNFAQLINSKDMGVPQNRLRIYMVSILRTEDDPNPTFHFPKPFPLTKKLKDVLEEHVDEKYYLSDKMLEYFKRVNDDDSHGHDFKPKDGEDTAFTLRTAPGNRVDDNFIKE